MRLVLDTSVTLAWVHSDEQSAATQALLDKVAAHGAIVPALWRLEVANALSYAVRRKRIDAGHRDESLRDLSDLDITEDPETNRHAWSATLHLAEIYGLTVYDAAYLELAQRMRAPLATLDQDLAEAAKKAGVEVWP